MVHRERPRVRAMKGYVSGFQPSSPSAIKLNTNENPYPPSPGVMAALKSIDPESLRRYPVPMADAFRREVSCVHGVDVDHVIATNGGDELLRLVVTTFVEPGRPIGVLEPSYSLYPVLAELHGCPLVRVDLAADWSVPDDAVDRFRGEGVALVFVVNPHAPSGHLSAARLIEAMAASLDSVLVVDEAYVDFVDPALRHDLTPLVRRFDNVLLLRTLSKGYGLAGLRLGYGLGDPALVQPMLTKTRDSYNVDAIAQRLGVAALEHRDEAERTWEAVRSERARLTRALRDLGFAVPDSQSNFVLATVPGGVAGAEALQRALEAEEIYVRRFDGARLADKLRITIGTSAETERLLLGIGRFVRCSRERSREG